MATKAVLDTSNVQAALMGQGSLGITAAQRALILAIAARLAWAFMRAHADDGTPIKILFFRVKYRQLFFLVELLFGPDPEATP